MKKILLALFAAFVFLPNAYAGECEIITDVNDYWVRVKSGVNIRDQVCDGNVIGTLSTGTVVKVTGHIEGWRHIERPEGGVGFVWGDFVEPTDAPEAEPAGNEPLYDVAGHVYETAIRYLGDNDIVQGYPDGSYQPEKAVNRAEFTKIIVGAKLGSEPAKPGASCFPDVPKDEWFASWVCYAKDQGIISGYPDGTFKPADNINLAEASKILVNTMDVPKAEVKVKFPWFQVFVESMQNLSYLPDSFTEFDQLVNRGQMAEMVWRIMEEVTNQETTSFSFEEESAGSQESEFISTGPVACLDDHAPSSINMDELRISWRNWHNAARAERGLSPLAMSQGLNYTSNLWSQENADKAELSHTRPGQSVLEWFEDAGLTFTPTSGIIYGENLGFHSYFCNSSDCTAEATMAAQNIFETFMDEEGTNYTGHYDNIVEEDFRWIGLGIAINEAQQGIYIATQYAAGVDKYPANVCEL